MSAGSTPACESQGRTYLALISSSFTADPVVIVMVPYARVTRHRYGAVDVTSCWSTEMMKFALDAKLTGSDGNALPVRCEVQPAFVGGQKAHIKMAVPARHLTNTPPESPCTLSGRNGEVSVDMQGVHWRRFPTSSNGTLGLEDIELLHIESLAIRMPSRSDRRDICFHLAPICYLRSESGGVSFDESHRKELFSLDLPDLGPTSFVVEWVTVYHRNAEVPGATVTAGFAAIATLPSNGPIEVARLVTSFRSSLDILSVLFRQAVSLHGWTYTDGETVTTWIDPLGPNVTPSAREDRGDFVAKPQAFAECATALTHAYARCDPKTRSLVRHLALAVAPHNKSRTADHFLFMFSALERVVESAFRKDSTPRSPARTDATLIALLEGVRRAVVTEQGEDATEISERLEGLVRIVGQPGIRDKFEAFFRVYPRMPAYSADLWPLMGSASARGLRDIRNALAHGRGSFLSADVVAVAEWHLAILMERVIFVLLDLPLPEGITAGSFLLRIGGRGWYERDRWYPLRSKPDRAI
jgi:hypothetical protein